MELVEQHFDTAFSAPNGIQKLRELILTLAMQGKLVPQEARDVPASQLLKEIEAEKKRLAKEGKIKAPKPLPEITSSDAPYALPQDWQWVRLGSVGNIFNGNSINASEKEAKYAGAKGLPYIATKDVGYGFDPLDYENGICIPIGQDKFRLAHEGAVLICAEGGSAGKKCGLTDRDICFGNKLFANELYGQVPSRFILYAYLSPIFRASFSAAMTGIIGGVSIAKFVEIPIPLPPLEEQHRIVAKVDQLMARCDALENMRDEREEKRLSTHAAALSQLLETTDKGHADDAWTFITQHFGELYLAKENVAELRKAILQLAVLGRLVPQNPNEGATQKVTMEELVGRKNLKNGLSLSPVDRPSDFACLPLSAMQGSTIDCSVGKPIEIDYNRAEPYLIKPRDIFIIRGNGSKDRVGIAGMARICPPNVLFPDLFIRVPLPPNKIDNDYFLIAWNSPVTREVLERLAATTSGIWKINQGHISVCEIPLPPLAEQKRIVAKVDELMALCDKLNKQIDAATDKQVELLNSVMAQV
jgi:type I restriction enzyme S subunit